MIDRPILFSAPMVRAILAGTKTQTRRVLRDGTWWNPKHGVIRMAPAGLACTGFAPVACPYGQPGDRLWVREAWAVPHRYDHLGPSNIPVVGVRAHYAATEDRGGLRWRPSIHMCRWASRIALEIVSVRVERLQDISVEDCRAEGGAYTSPLDVRAWYRALWESINGPGSWEANPWVWVVEFRAAPKEQA